MPRNPLLGIPSEEEAAKKPSEEQADEAEGAAEADEEIEEDEESEDLSDEDESEDEEEEAEEKPAKKAAPKASKKAAKPAEGTGTLGDARIDRSIPMSAKATAYLQLLLASPLVTSIIPPDVLNEDSEHTFCINSLRVIVPKGRMIQVPFMLAQEIKQSFGNRF